MMTPMSVALIVLLHLHEQGAGHVETNGDWEPEGNGLGERNDWGPALFDVAGSSRGIKVHTQKRKLCSGRDLISKMDPTCRY